MQVVFYGYGTGWHWSYYFSMIVQALTSIFLLSGLRYRLAIWKTLTLVKAWTVLIILAAYIEVLLPIPGFLTVKMLHVVPFRSPTWALAYLYIMVSTIHAVYLCCACQRNVWFASPCVGDNLLILQVCSANAMPTVWWGAVQVPFVLLAGHVCSLLCIVTTNPQINNQCEWHKRGLTNQ
jgi:hypothetical protein